MKVKEMDRVNGKHIYMVDTGDTMEWLVTDLCMDEKMERKDLINGNTFHTLVEAVEYAKDTDDYYSLTVRLDTVEAGADRDFFYVFHSMDEALAKAKQVIDWEGLPTNIYKELVDEQESEWGDFGMMSIEPYYLGERLS